MPNGRWLDALPMSPWRRCNAVLLALTVLPACGGLSSVGLLGENFPPHDIGFVEYVAPEFPFRLRATAIGDGRAVVAMTVRDDGSIDDAVALEASHAAFAESVLEAASGWILAEADATTIPRREVLHFEFRRSGVATSVTHREAAGAPFAEIDERTPAIRTVTDDDHTPQRVDDAGEALTSLPASVAGVASVNFVVDRQGRVRVPVVEAGVDESLAAAAVELVSRWRYAPTLVDGEPVLVEVSRSLNFTPAAD